MPFKHTCNYCCKEFDSQNLVDFMCRVCYNFLKAQEKEVKR